MIKKNSIALYNDCLGATRFHADWEPISSGIRRAGIPGKTRENMPLQTGKGNQAYKWGKWIIKVEHFIWETKRGIMFKSLLTLSANLT